MEAKGEVPAARSAHTSVVVGKSMIVFGGWNGAHCMNDMYELKLDTATWSKVAYTGEAPCTRCPTVPLSLKSGVKAPCLCLADMPLRRRATMSTRDTSMISMSSTLERRSGHAL